MTTPTAEAGQPRRITRLFKGEVEDVNESKRTITHKISTDCIDRYNEVVVGRGICLDNYLHNPVVLWCHNSYVVIGKNLWTKRQAKDGRTGLIAKTLFARTDTASEIFELYAGGFLNGWSIGAHPDYKAVGAPTEEEIKARPELKDCRRMYRRCELVEYSACSIPANPEALGNEVGKAISADLRRQIEDGERWDGTEPIILKTDRAEALATGTVTTPELPPLIGRTFEEELARSHASFRAMTSKSAAEQAARDAIDRHMGRV